MIKVSRRSALAFIATGTSGGLWPTVGTTGSAVSQPFLPWANDSASEGLIRVVIAQNEPGINFTVTSSPQIADPSLVGAILGGIFNGAQKGMDDASNNARKNQAVRFSLPLQGKGLGRHFSDEFMKSVSDAAHNSSWLHVKAVELVQADNSLIEEETRDRSFTRLTPTYILSENGLVLIVRIIVEYYRKGESRLSHHRDIYYFSDQAPGSDLSALVENWAADQGAQFRVKEDEGIRAVVDALNRDFLVPKFMLPNTSVRIQTFEMLDVDGKRHKLRASVLATDGSRKLANDQYGRLTSFVPIG